jgi:hypothetical protein
LEIQAAARRNHPTVADWVRRPFERPAGPSRVVSPINWKNFRKLFGHTVESFNLAVVLPAMAPK